MRRRQDRTAKLIHYLLGSVVVVGGMLVAAVLRLSDAAAQAAASVQVP